MTPLARMQRGLETLYRVDTGVDPDEISGPEPDQWHLQVPEPRTDHLVQAAPLVAPDVHELRVRVSGEEPVDARVVRVGECHTFGEAVVVHDARREDLSRVAPRSAGDIVEIPDALKVGGTYLIFSEVKYKYVPSVAWFINKVNGITLSDFAYTRPRQGLCVMYNTTVCTTT